MRKPEATMRVMIAATSAVFAVVVVVPASASADCPGYNPDVTEQTCAPGWCCEWGTCTYVVGAGGYIGAGLCLADNGAVVSGSYDSVPNCFSLQWIDAGPTASPPNAAICVGLRTGDACNAPGQCASGICQPDSGVALEWNNYNYGYCVPDGYKGPCAIGDDFTRTKVEIGAGCDSGNCVLHNSVGGICGLPWKDAGVTGVPCSDSSWCWGPGGYTCDVDTGPFQLECVPVCQADGAECQDGGFNDCCGTDVCINSVCVPCVHYGHACTDHRQCCQEFYHGIEGDYEVKSCNFAIGGGTCGIWQEDSPCYSSLDCQDPRWVCGPWHDAGECSALGVGNLGCSVGYDCVSACACDAGWCCLPTNTALSSHNTASQCCSDNINHSLSPPRCF